MMYEKHCMQLVSLVFAPEAAAYLIAPVLRNEVHVGTKSLQKKIELKQNLLNKKTSLFLCFFEII